MLRPRGGADRTDGRQRERRACKRGARMSTYFASGSGRNWNFTTELRVPEPPSMCQTAFGP